jgi:hypothetical protein
MKLRHLLAAFVFPIIYGALILPAAAVTATNYTMTFDERGNCSFTVGSTNGNCAGVFVPDPAGKVTGNIWIFTLPELGYTGNINVYEPDGKTLSDRMAFVDQNNNPLGCIPGSGTLCATHMLFYSVDDNGQIPTLTTPVFVNENADGSFHFVSVLGNTFDGLSDVPLPAALPLFASGLVGLGLLGWRRKKRAAPLNA